MATVSEAMPLEQGLEEKITRFDIHQIIQHAILMVSFILLVVTGFPLKYHESAISQWWVGVWGGIEVTRAVHHLAGWVMVFVCLYHLAYLWYTIVILKRPFPIKMIPSPHDFVKLIQELGYFLGLRKEMPRYDRFNWKEKFDYWAIFWGIPVMAGSGFILMYPVLATRFLPGWVVPVALVAHSDEALLALTWIFLVHIFFNHFTPGIFPFNSSIFTGKVSGERYRRDHPLEYERLYMVEEDEEGETVEESVEGEAKE
ncbi:MAG: cytochrome b/b6 domain-containing protein [Dehalococcoidales bacterium]|nr:cytochrome b/b6 domain-containing protein [Dehalococcoidales bacterium]MDZ4246125.1 cytochrome b/b6 domain-containing protein [Dehalococcoidia bacterium]